jgi:hypothetical protein
MLEVGFGGMHDLLGRQRAAGMTAHAIGDDSQRHALAARMRQYRHAILLFLAIPLVLRSARIDCYRHPSSLWGKIITKEIAAG